MHGAPMRFLRSIAQVLVTAFHRLGCERGFEAAASMSFYAVFSMFPLFLLLAAVAGSVLSTADAQERFLEAVLGLVPVSPELLLKNVTAVVRSRGAVGGIGVVGLVWAASSAFGALVRNLNRAWPCSKPRNLLGERLLSLAIVASLAILVILFVVAKALVVLPGEWESAQRVVTSVLELVPSQASLWGFILVVLTLLYRWLPRTVVLWREALVGAAACSLALWGATTLFVRFLASGLVSYNLVYGSLGALLALLSWVYIACALLLCGAHLAAAVAINTRHARLVEENGVGGEGGGGAGGGGAAEGGKGERGEGGRGAGGGGEVGGGDVEGNAAYGDGRDDCGCPGVESQQQPNADSKKEPK